jgi:hypothetical protein
MLIILTEAAAIDTTARVRGVAAVLQHCVYERRCKEPPRVVLHGGCCPLRPLRVALCDWAFAVCKGAVVVLTKVGAAAIPGSSRKWQNVADVEAAAAAAASTARSQRVRVKRPWVM